MLISIYMKQSTRSPITSQSIHNLALTSLKSHPCMNGWSWQYFQFPILRVTALVSISLTGFILLYYMLNEWCTSKIVSLRLIYPHLNMSVWHANHSQFFLLFFFPFTCPLFFFFSFFLLWAFTYLLLVILFPIFF